MPIDPYLPVVGSVPAARRHAHRRRAGAAACLLVCAACADLEDVRFGLGGRALLVDRADRSKKHGYDEDRDVLLLDPKLYDIRGRAADVTASLGFARVQAIGGYEWSQKGSEHWQARLLGMRVLLSEAELCAGPYAILLGRTVAGANARTAYFDGFDLGVGYLGPLRGHLYGDFCMSWSYVDGDAIRIGHESLSEIRFAFGLRFEW